MRRDGRVRGKPSSRTRRCKSGNSRKPFPKRFGSSKRITVDDPVLTDLNRDFEDDREPLDEVVDSGSPIIPTVNTVIEMALSKSLSSIDGAKLVPGDGEMFHGMGSSSKIVGVKLDIPAIEEAFHRDLGIFENAVEGDSFAETQFTRKWGAVLSEESWSDVEFVEFSDLEEEDNDDDWFVVLDDDHG